MEKLIFHPYKHDFSKMPSYQPQYLSVKPMVYGPTKLMKLISYYNMRGIKVFLGGTCNGSLWRETLIPMLGAGVEYFNPVVKDWTPECQEREIQERENCDVCLYVITPKMTGVYSIAEAVDDSNKRPEKTLFCFTDADFFGEDTGAVAHENVNYPVFDRHQVKSLKMVGAMVEKNGGTWAKSLEEVATMLNGVANNRQTNLKTFQKALA